MLGNRALTLGICTLVSLSFSNSSFAQDWSSLNVPSFINQSSGLDRLWDTPDDVADLGGGAGANTAGSTFIWNSPFGGPVFLQGSMSLDSLVTMGTGTYTQTAFSSSGELLGVGPIAVDTPSFISPSTLSVASDQSIVLEQFWGPAGLEYKTVATGFVIFSDDDINALVADTATANHISLLVDLLPANWESALYFDGEFLGLDDVPNGLGQFAGFFYTAPVPLPAPILLLGAAIATLLPMRRRA